MFGDRVILDVGTLDRGGILTSFVASPTVSSRQLQDNKDPLVVSIHIECHRRLRLTGPIVIAADAKLGRGVTINE